MANPDDLKILMAITKPVIEPILKTILQPKIDQLAKWLKKAKLKHSVADSWIEDQFALYLTKTYNNFQNINILIFQNQQINIKDIYFPLTIRSSKDSSTFKIDNLEALPLEDYGKILISDTAGMGKSTIVKWIGMQVIEQNLGIPILIELRNLKDNHSILDEVQHQFSSLNEPFDSELLFKFLESGNFVILLDGFDEIHLKDQELIIKDIRNFVNKTENNSFILTSRPEGALASFGDFQLFNILPLRREEAFEVINKYDSLCPEKIGSRLISDIKQNYDQTSQLLQNPFLVSLLYITYTYNKDIPSSKVIFYEEIYSALFKRHDLSKNGWTRPKKSKLDIQQFKIVLRQLAFDTAVKGEVIYSEPEMLQHLENSKKKCPGVDFSVVDFFDDLLSSVPLFQRDGLKVKWSHKSLQDYFAADYIAFSSKKEEIIDRIYSSQRDSFLNILDLFYEMDFKTFRNIIIQRLLTDFIEYCNNSYIGLEEIPESNVSERKALTFGVNVVFLQPAEDMPFNEIFVFVQNQFPQIKESKHRAALIGFHQLMLVYFFTFTKQLIELLSSRKLSFINVRKVSEKDIPLDILTKEPYLLTDSPDFFLNNKSVFTKVNHLLQRVNFVHSTRNVVTVSYQQALVELRKIQEEVRNESSQDTFHDI